MKMFHNMSYTVTSRELVRQVPKERWTDLPAFLLGDTPNTPEMDSS